MKIRKLDNGKAGETCGQIGNRNFIGIYLKPVAFDKKRIAGDQCPDSPENAAFDELSSSYSHRNFSPTLSGIKPHVILIDCKEWILFYFFVFQTGFTGLNRIFFQAFQKKAWKPQSPPTIRNT